MPGLSRTSFDRVNRSPRLSDVVADRLLEAVVTQQFRPGEALPSERELSLQFGVSRTVIREAIRALSTKGVVEVLSGRGVRVLPLDTGPVREAMSLLVRRNPDATFTSMHEVRVMLEPHVATVAAERARDDDIALIDDLVRRIARVVAEGEGHPTSVHEFDAALHPDVEFHRAIAGAAHNGLYVMIFDALSSIIFEVRPDFYACLDGPFPFLDEYRAIADAIKRGDPSAARVRMEEHLAHVWEIWNEHLGPARDAALAHVDLAGPMGLHAVPIPRPDLRSSRSPVTPFSRG
jgi:GntR family transcriptional repressor for pyruvate dehydrogenase complex